MGEIEEQGSNNTDQGCESDEARRRKAMARARRLIADPDYPDRATLEKIAGLLADKIDSAESDLPSTSSSE